MSAPNLAPVSHLRLIRPRDHHAPVPVGLARPERIVAEFTAVAAGRDATDRRCEADGDVDLVVRPDGSWTYTVAVAGREPLVLCGGAHEPALMVWRRLLAFLRQDPAEECS